MHTCMQYGVHQQLRVGAALGPKSVNAAQLNRGGEDLAAARPHLVNRCWKDKVVPAEWQTATLVPLYKSDDKADPSNYRGITIQPVAIKLL